MSLEVCKSSENELTHICYFFCLQKGAGTRSDCLFSVCYQRHTGGGCFCNGFPLIRAAKCTETVNMTVNFRLPEGCYKSGCGKCEIAPKLPLMVLSTSDRATGCFPIRGGFCSPWSHEGAGSGRGGCSPLASGSPPEGECGNGNWKGN